MSVVRCEECDMFIDTDFDAEHFDECVGNEQPEDQGFYDNDPNETRP